jgi:hypothetical protein
VIIDGGVETGPKKGGPSLNERRKPQTAGWMEERVSNKKKEGIDLKKGAFKL